MELCRRVRQIEEMSPYRDHLDGAVAGLDSLGFVPRHDGSGLKAQFSHRLAQGRRLPFPRLRFGQGLTHLNQHSRATTHRNDEVDLPAGLRLVIVDPCRPQSELYGQNVHGARCGGARSAA